MIKIKEVYTLIKKDIPEIRGKNIISDARVGGEKLVYKRKSFPVRIYQFYFLKIVIPLIVYRKRAGGLGLDITTSEVVYFRPYKKNWSHRKNKLPFHLWGKKDHPLTNIWTELEFDYQDIMKEYPVIKTRIEDHSLIKILRQHDEKFVLFK